MSDKRPLAVVTGASSGIGFELAAQFARNGFDLLVNARNGQRLETAADGLRALGGEVRPVRADLRTYDGVEVLYAAILATGRPVAAAALNAGIGKGGPFLENDLGDEAAIIDLNITSTVHLAKRLLKDMVAHGQGRLLFVSSIAATMPGSFQAVYNASKSFLQSFAEALQEELKDTGVTVTSALPGPTDTDFFRRAGMEDTRIARSTKDDPAAVAEQAFQALMAGKRTAVTGSVKTKVQEAAGKVLPDRLKAAGHRRMAEPGSGDEGGDSGSGSGGPGPDPASGSGPESRPGSGSG